VLVLVLEPARQGPRSRTSTRTRTRTRTIR